MQSYKETLPSEYLKIQISSSGIKEKEVFLFPGAMALLGLVTDMQLPQSIWV